MRKIICIVICIAFIHSVNGQETYQVPERTQEQKRLSEIYSQWDILSSAISITRTHGVSPYEYGKYTGDLFASSWNKENGFDIMMQCIKGIEEQIAEYLGYTFKMEIEEEWSPCNSTLYYFAIITITNRDPAV